MNAKVLLVDDDSHLMMVLRRVLSAEFVIWTATDSYRALTIINAEGPFAVVVSDIVLPELDGIELLKRVRMLWPETVRVVLSGAVDQATLIALREVETFRVLAKPCPSGTLFNALHDGVLQYSRMMEEAS